MKVTNGDIFGATQAFQEILKIELPVKTSWMLAKLASKVDALFKNIDKARSGLVARLGTVDKKTGQVEIKPSIQVLNTETQELEDKPNPAWAEFVAGYNELMEQEDEIDMEKIKIPEEINGKPIMVSANTLFALGKFIEV
jgi:hypothetical protein